MSEANAVSVEDGLNFIEQLQKLSSGECIKVNRPHISGVSNSAGLVVLMKPTCKCWNCPSCGARNGQRWVARVINHINHSDIIHGWRFFTLTSHERMRGVHLSVKCLRSGWKKLYNRIRYQHDANSFVKVWEAHADKTFHLHGMMDAPLDEDWLSDNAAECGMGWSVDVSPIFANAGMVAGYICKYMLKSASVTNEYPRGLRRIEVSRDWMKLPEIEGKIPFKWTINSSREGQLYFAEHYKFHGYQIIDTVSVMESNSLT